MSADVMLLYHKLQQKAIIFILIACFRQLSVSEPSLSGSFPLPHTKIKSAQMPIESICLVRLRCS